MARSADDGQRTGGWTRGLALGGLVLVLVALSAPSATRADSAVDEARLTGRAADLWPEVDAGHWNFPALLTEAGEAFTDLPEDPAPTIDAVAGTYGVSKAQAVGLLEVEIVYWMLGNLPVRDRVGGLEDDASRRDVLLELEATLADGLEGVDPETRTRVLLRFYGGYQAQPIRERSLEVAASMVEPLLLGLGDPSADALVLDASALDALWTLVQAEGLDRTGLYARLLEAVPGSTWVLRRLTEDIYDPLWTGAIHLYLAEIDGDIHDVAKAYDDLLRGGTTAQVVADWLARVESLEGGADPLADGPAHRAAAERAEAKGEWPFDFAVLRRAMVAALWLEGRADAAEKLFAPMKTVPELPLDVMARLFDDGILPAHLQELVGDRYPGEILAEDARRRFLAELLDPKGREPYEVLADLLQIRVDGGTSSLPGPAWWRALAQWAQISGDPTIERYAAGRALVYSGVSLLDDPHRHQDPSELMRRGLLPANLVARYQELRRGLETRIAELEARVAALDDTTAGYFRESSLLDEAPRVTRKLLDTYVAPFRIDAVDDDPDAPDRLDEWSRERALLVSATYTEPESDRLVAELLGTPESFDVARLPFQVVTIVDWVADTRRPERMAIVHWLEHRPRGNGLSNHGLWITRSDDGGLSWSPSVSAGWQLGGPLDWIQGLTRLEGGTLTITAVGPALDAVQADPATLDPQPTSDLVVKTEKAAYELSVDLDDLFDDTDGDGWSDVFEQRLGTDPDAADTDGDDLPDASDPLPSRPYESSTASEAFVAVLRYALELDHLVPQDWQSEDEEPLFEEEDARPGAPEPVPDLFTVVGGAGLSFGTWTEDTPLVLVPEELAFVPGTAGPAALQIHLFVTNHASDRAILQWSDFPSRSGGMVEFERRGDTWVPVAGSTSAGCMGTLIRPPEKKSADLVDRPS